MNDTTPFIPTHRCPAGECIEISANGELIKDVLMRDGEIKKYDYRAITLLPPALKVGDRVRNKAKTYTFVIHHIKDGLFFEKETYAGWPLSELEPYAVSGETPPAAAPPA